MAKTTKTDAPAVMELDNAGWTDAGGNEGAELEGGIWVELKGGEVFEGTLLDACLIPGTEEGEAPRAAYVVREADGGKVNLGERFGLRPLRNLRLGTTVRIQVTGQKKLSGGRTLWQFKVQHKEDGTGELVSARFARLAAQLSGTAAPF